MLKISLITPNLNQARFLRQTIESVLSQRGEFQLDYRVLDGGSTDGSLRILEEYRQRVAYLSSPDSGQVDGLNRGLATATGDVLGWLNSDDVLLPGALARVCKAFETHPHVEWVHGRCLIIDEWGRETLKWVSAYKHSRCLRHSFENLLRENYVSQMTAFWRRSAWQQVGPLDASVPLAFDYDLWLRMAQRGAPYYIEEPIAAFRRHPLSLSGRAYGDMFRQEVIVARRHGGNRRHLLWAKGVRTSLFRLIYRALDLLRREAGGPRVSTP